MLNHGEEIDRYLERVNDLLHGSHRSVSAQTDVIRRLAAEPRLLLKQIATELRHLAPEAEFLAERAETLADEWTPEP